MNNLEKLVQKLAADLLRLTQEVNALKQTSSIPLEVDRAFVGRGFVKTFPAGIPDPDGDYTTNIGFRQEINLSGDPQTISAPAFPVRFLKLSDGTNLYIPLYTYAEFGV